MEINSMMTFAVTRYLRPALLALGIAATMVGPSSAQSVADFYQGKTVKLIVGSDAGGGYDAYARVLAPYFGKHIPGSPVVVVQNMPGASGMRSANYLYEVAPKDGTVLAIFNQAMPSYELTSREGVRFKSAELNWIGTMSKVNSLFVTWHTTGVKTLEDAKKQKVILGALAEGGTMATYPALINQALGTQFHVVLGYQSGAAVDLAMERGEVQGRGSVVLASYEATRPDWLMEHKINILFQIGLEKEPKLPDVPLLIDLAKDPAQKQLFELASADTVLGRPIVAPQGMPQERVAALRKAFDETMQDPEFLAEVEKRRMEISPTSGEKVQAVIKSMLATPPDVVATYAKVISTDAPK
jgi:tripartite-type tricarboxylate transporter receptor subunit TctC